MTKKELKQFQDEVDHLVYDMGFDTFETDGHSDYAVKRAVTEYVQPKIEQLNKITNQLNTAKKLMETMLDYLYHDDFSSTRSKEVQNQMRQFIKEQK